MMGYNTTILVLNDALHHIRDDNAFGQKVYQAVLIHQRDNEKTTDISVHGHCNAASVIETHHADEQHLFLVGGNNAVDLGYAGHWSKDYRKVDDLKSLLNTIAQRHGLQVVKSRKKHHK
jgi:hypothetical protein